MSASTPSSDAFMCIKSRQAAHRILRRSVQFVCVSCVTRVSAQRAVLECGTPEAVPLGIDNVVRPDWSHSMSVTITVRISVMGLYLQVFLSC